MNDELKSIAQLAQELGVTRQAIYQRLKGKELAKAVKPYVVRQGNACKYDLQAQELIKQAFCGAISSDFKEELTEIKEEFKVVSNELTQCKNQLESALNDVNRKNTELQQKEQALNELTKSFTILESENNELEKVKIRFEEQQSVISALHNQISDRDKTIIDLKDDKDKLNTRLDIAEETISNLTVALQAAQALHGIEKRQAAIVDQTDTVAEEPLQQPQKKRSWLDKLLRRK